MISVPVGSFSGPPPPPSSPLINDAIFFLLKFLAGAMCACPKEYVTFDLSGDLLPQATVRSRKTMEVATESKCCALCQHPGCWHAGKKQPPLHKLPPEFIHYLTHLAVRRKLKEWRNEADTEPEGRCALIRMVLPFLIRHKKMYT